MCVKDKDVDPFSLYIFKVNEENFEQIAGFCREEFVGKVQTWSEFIATINFNYIQDGTKGATSLLTN